MPIRSELARCYPGDTVSNTSQSSGRRCSLRHGEPFQREKLRFVRFFASLRVDMLSAHLGLIIFDLDGTLVDTSGDLIRATNHALQMIRQPPVGAESLRHLCGQGARALLSRALAENGVTDAALVEQGVIHFLRYYSDNINVESVIYDGLPETLEILSDSGLRLAVCTNKPEALARKLITAIGWGEKFDAIVGGDTATASKPSAAPLKLVLAMTGQSRGVMVGDSDVDALAAHAAGMPFVGIHFSGDQDLMSNLDFAVEITNYHQLQDALQSIAISISSNISRNR